MTTPACPGQQELDSRIAELERQILDLKHRRNELAFISRIPAEILCEILLLATTLPNFDLEIMTEQLRVKGHIRTLGHVSRTWRSITLSCPQLWAGIDVRTTSNAALLETLVDRAHLYPLSITIKEQSTADGAVDWRDLQATIKQTLFKHELSFRQVILRGNSQFLMSYLTICVSSTALHTICAINDDPHAFTWLPNTPAMTIPQCALFASAAPELRVLDLYGCQIPLTSPILTSSTLTHIVMTLPQESTARQLNDMLRNTSQLEYLSLMLPHAFQPSDSPSLEANVPRLAQLLLGGNVTSALATLRQLQLTSTNLCADLQCFIPTPLAGVQQQVGEDLFKALAKARVASPQNDRLISHMLYIQEIQHFSPTILKVDFQSGCYCLAMQEWDNPHRHGWNRLISCTRLDIQLFDEETGERIDDGDWLPLFGYSLFEERLRAIGWFSPHTLNILSVTNFHTTYPCESFWTFISEFGALQEIHIAARYAPDILPFLSTGYRQPATFIHLAFPVLRRIIVHATDTSVEEILQLAHYAFEERRRLVAESQGCFCALDSLTFFECESPPSQSSLEAIPPTLISHVSWTLRLR